MKCSSSAPDTRLASGSDSRRMRNVSHTLTDLQGKYERLELLYQVSKVIHSTLEPQQALQLILREAVRIMRASSGSAVLLKPISGFLEIQASQGLPGPVA